MFGSNLAAVNRGIRERSTPTGYQVKTVQLDCEGNKGKLPEEKEAPISSKTKVSGLGTSARLKSRANLWQNQTEGGRTNFCVCKETIYQCLYADSWAHDEESY